MGLVSWPWAGMYKAILEVHPHLANKAGLLILAQ